MTNESKPLLSVLQGSALEIPPIWFMRQAGRYLPEYQALRRHAGSFLNLCLTPEWAAQVTLQPINRFFFDGAILFSDILIVPMALGQGLEFVEGEGPHLFPRFSPSLLSVLSVERAREQWAPIIETVRLVSQALPSSVTLLGFAGAPWTVATYMMEGRGGTGFQESLKWVIEEPILLKKLMDLLVEATALYLKEQIEAGAEVIQIFDTWASVLPPASLKDWVYGPTKSLVDKIREWFPGFPIIGFPKGIGLDACKTYQKETGVTALSLDRSVMLSEARQVLSCPLQGNLDPEILKAGGALLESSVREICEAMRGFPHIFNLGHGILQGTPPEHVQEVIKIVREKRHTPCKG